MLAHILTHTKRLKGIAIGVTIALAVFLIGASVVLALANPDAISFGIGDPRYRVFYNVLEADDWLVTAEGYVYYNESAYSTLVPDGAGAETNLTPEGAATNWECVAATDNDSKYVTVNSTSYVRDLYTLEDSSSVSLGTIVNVGVYFRIRNSGTATTYGIPELYIGGNNYNGSAQTATNSWQTKNEAFSTNPATGDAWVWTDINNLQIGISLASDATSGNASCSAVYAVVSYTRDNPGLDADEAFLFQLLNTTGNETIAQVPLQAYGDRPISIYLDADQVSAASLNIGDPYIIRICGNPSMFASMTGNSVNATLGVDKYVDQELGVDGGVAENNNLRTFLIGMADDMETYDNPAEGYEYVVTVKGTRYLTLEGGNLFLEGIPSLDSMCPILFQYGSEPMEGDAPETTGAYASTLTPLNQWGQTVANGLTNLGLYLGISQALAGSAVLLILAVGLAVFVYARTQSGVAALMLVSCTPFVGAWFGLMSLALAIIIVMVIVVLLGFFFLSRGAL